MTTIVRRSAVRFPAPVSRSEQRDGWEVVLAYENEGEHLSLVDLSHCPLWDLQDHDLEGGSFADLSIPTTPGGSRLESGVLVSRMNGTQASVWHLGPSPRLVQGPFSHVPCQIVVFSPQAPRPGLLLTCSRGYARDMIASLLHAGEHDGLRPAGEAAFTSWLGEQ